MRHRIAWALCALASAACHGQELDLGSTHSSDGGLDATVVSGSLAGTWAGYVQFFASNDGSGD
ncbi:MAG TPA: hypothetical protein VGI39_24110, partial [Polyangiaceae bacterium]